METRPLYEFVIRMANCDVKDCAERIKSALSMYVVEAVSSPRRMPIQEHADFPQQGPCEVQIVEVTLKYPTITDQVRAIIAEKCGMSANSVVVRTKFEESQREPQAAPKKDKNGSVLTNPDISVESGQHLVGSSRAESMLKSLQPMTRKFEFAAQGEKSKSAEMPQGTKSPVGSTQNKLPSPKGK